MTKKNSLEKANELRWLGCRENLGHGPWCYRHRAPYYSNFIIRLGIASIESNKIVYLVQKCEKIEIAQNLISSFHRRTVPKSLYV